MPPFFFLQSFFLIGPSSEPAPDDSPVWMKYDLHHNYLHVVSIL